MEKRRFNKFYRVFKNDTAVTEVSFNDFRHLPQNEADKPFSSSPAKYSLLAENEMYYGYELKTRAMEMAKAGALKYIAMLIAEGHQSTEKVYQYRFDHYEDLNVNLKDSNIRRFIV